MSIKVLLLFGGVFGILWFISSIGGRNSVRKRSFEAIKNSAVDAVVNPPKAKRPSLAKKDRHFGLFDDDDSLQGFS